MLAPVTSQSSDIELILDTRWARKAFATSLDNSEDHKFVVIICFLGTQASYI